MNASVDGIGVAPPGETTVSIGDAENAVRQWLNTYLSEVLGVDAESIDDRSTFERYGLDSSAAVALAADLGTWLGVEVDPSITYDYPSVGELACSLAAEAMRAGRVPFRPTVKGTS